MHVARVVVHAVVGLMRVLNVRVIVVVYGRRVSVASLSVFGGILFTLHVGDSKLRWLLPN